MFLLMQKIWNWSFFTLKGWLEVRNHYAKNMCASSTLQPQHVTGVCLQRLFGLLFGFLAASGMQGINASSHLGGCDVALLKQNVVRFGTTLWRKNTVRLRWFLPVCILGTKLCSGSGGSLHSIHNEFYWKRLSLWSSLVGASGHVLDSLVHKGPFHSYQGDYYQEWSFFGFQSSVRGLKNALRTMCSKTGANNREIKRRVGSQLIPGTWNSLFPVKFAFVKLEQTHGQEAADTQSKHHDDKLKGQRGNVRLSYCRAESPGSRWCIGSIR